MKHAKPAIAEAEVTLQAADIKGVLWFEEGEWFLASRDLTSGKVEQTESLTPDQAAALMRLFITGGEHEGAVGDYALLGDIFDNWSNGARPIP